MSGRKRFTLSFPNDERAEIESEAKRQEIEPTTLIARWARAGRIAERVGAVGGTIDSRDIHRVEATLSRICFILELIGDDAAVTSAAIKETLTQHPERLEAARLYAKHRGKLISKLRDGLAISANSQARDQ